MPTLLSPRPFLLATGALAAAALVVASAVPANADAVALSVSVAAPTVTLPIGDGYQDHESLSIAVSAPATATVVLQRAGGESSTLAQDLPLAAGSNPLSVPTTGLVAGDWTATVTTTDGAVAVAAFAVQPLDSRVTKVAVSRSLSTVYPVKDGYRDSVVFTVTPTLSAGPASAKVTGTATLTRAGHTAKAWKLHSGVDRLVWNGKDRGAVRPGRYVLTVRAKGAQGAARTVRSSVTVSPKRLVARTTTVVKEASSALQRFRGYDGNANDCGYVGAFVLCTVTTAQGGAPYAAIVGGELAVPKTVRAATKYAKPDVRLALRTTKLTGSATWGYGVGTAHTTRSVKKGTTTGEVVRWSGNPATTIVFIGLDDSSALSVDRFVLTYRYRTLR